MKILKLLFLKNVALIFTIMFTMTMFWTIFCSEYNALQTQTTALQRLSLDAAQMTLADFFENMLQIARSGEIKLQGTILVPDPLTIINRQLITKPDNATLLFAQRLLTDLQNNPNAVQILNSSNQAFVPRVAKQPSRRVAHSMETIQEE